MACLAIYLLGGWQVTLDDDPVTDFATDKARALLAYLAVETERPHRRDTLAGLLWPDQPQDHARQNLRQTLTYLRQAIGRSGEADAFLLINRETVQFKPDCDYRLDVTEFHRLALACREHHHRRWESCVLCMRRMAQLDNLYRGEFLAGFSLTDSCVFDEWSVLEREWLHREIIDALYHLTNYHERRGDFEKARQYAWRQVTLEPWREEAHRQLMRLLALDGQRSAALVQYETCCRILAEELGVEPTAETSRLYEHIRAGTERVTAVHVSACGHNLPPEPTPFVGREVELAELAEHLANPACRLVTLLGLGGIGKTRLALQVAAEQIGAFADGIYFAPLTSLSSAEYLLPLLATVLNFSYQDQQDLEEQLLGYLHEKELLLVLDNMEHLLASASVSPPVGEERAIKLLTKILLHAPGVILLVTSRERLALQEEWVYPVEGLTYPVGEPAADLETYGAINLFQQSARQAEPGFALSSAEIPAVVHICRLVEGMPLGIELAAAGAAVRSCREIAQDLKLSFDGLATSLRNVPARQRSLRATFDYSWQLLSEAEKILFSRLSVFRGGFRPETAALLAETSPVMLAALRHKSLLRRVSASRYDMYELLRQYAAEKLALYPAEYEQTHTTHLRYFAAFLAQQEEHLKGARQKQALAEISPEIENVRQAWSLAIAQGWAHEVEQSLESLYHFFDIQGRFQEGIELLTQAIDRWRDDAHHVPLFGKAMSRQGALYHRLGLYQLARSSLEQSLALFEQLGLPAGQIFCLNRLAHVARSQGKLDETERLSQQSLALSRQTGDKQGAALSLFLLGTVRYSAGDVDQAETLLHESLSFARESGNQRLMLSPLNTLGDIACYWGDYARAQSLFNECLAISRDLGDLFNTARHLNNLGTALHVLKKYGKAQALYQASLEICRAIGDQAGQAVALSSLGEIAFVLGDYAEAQQYYRQGLAIGRAIQNQRAIMACLNNLGEIACALGDYQTATAHLAEAIKLASETGTLTALMKTLVNLAVLLAKQGQAGRAATILALVRRHPASEQNLQEKAGRLLDEMSLAAPESLSISLDELVVEITSSFEDPEGFV